MQVRWKGLELPAAVINDPKSSSPTFGRFIAEPFERGFGTTVGNSLRRILLSCIEGTAITKVSIKGVSHEFSTVPGVLQDVTDIIMNAKGIIVSMDEGGPRTMRLAAEGPGDVTAELIEADTSITIHNPELVVATLTEPIDFEMEFTVERGRGYHTVLDLRLDHLQGLLREARAWNPTQAAGQARRLGAELALCLQGSLMARYAPEAVSVAFCEARLRPATPRVYGDLDPKVNVDDVLTRAEPLLDQLSALQR